MVQIEMTVGVWLASAIYRAALIACPRALRARYGDEMMRTFRTRARDAPGARARALLLARELLDLAHASVDARRPFAFRPLPSTVQEFPVTTIVQDLRYALRTLRRQPGFAGVAILTMGLGIGATTAVFTVVNGVLLRPLPYARPAELVQLLHGRNGRLTPTYSPPNFLDVTTQSGVFSGATAISPTSANLTGAGEPVQLQGAEVTPSFFGVLGVVPQLGRGLVDADGAGAGADVVVLGDSLWRRQFGARTDIVGSTIRLDGKPMTVVGVAPPRLGIPGGAEYWRPLVFTPRSLSDSARGAQWIGGIARLKEGVTLEQAKVAMASVATRLARDFPRTNKDRVMTAISLHDRIVRGVRPALLMLFGAVGLVLVVACVNVANLLLARANARTREVAVRAAIGAGRGRLVQQFLVESLALGVGGGVVGLVVAVWSTRALLALEPAGLPRLAEISVDWHVLAFAIGAGVCTSVLFGIVPALAATGHVASRFISSAGRGTVGHRGVRTRRALVVCEMGLAVVLLVGAGLLVRSYQRISDVNPGFASDHVLTFTLGFPSAAYPNGTAVDRAVSDYLERLNARPGVEAAAGVFGLPLDDNFSASSSFTRKGEADGPDTPSVGMRIITPDYLKALKIPLKAGRDLDSHDDETGAEVVLVNHEAARRYWPGQNPIGQQLHLGVQLVSGVRSGMKTIVGVVGDVKYGGLELTSPPEVYLPHAQHPVDSLTIVVRTAGDPAAFVPIARADLAAIDRDLPLAAVRTLDQVVGRSIAERRFTMLLLATFAAVALTLAMIGIYGVLAYLVSQRTREIGVRLAIGAAPADVVRLFVREGLALAAIGLAVGLIAAIGAARALTTMLFGVTATDPLTFATVAFALGLTALAASYLPARRAAAVDPMNALRTD